MCAIFGIAGQQEASNLTYLGLHALQHRGQEGAGIILQNYKAIVPLDTIVIRLLAEIPLKIYNR